jgi:hypothetical protein
VSYRSTHFMFRDLTDAEQSEFAAFARTNDPGDNWHLLHPVCRQVWLARGVNGCTPQPCADCTAAYAGLEAEDSRETAN